MTKIPTHLAKFPWYGPHLAWLRQFHSIPTTHDPVNAKPRRADLSDADLSGADLSGAVLRRAVLSDAVPLVENIDARILAACSADGCSLKMNDWHTCETTHCRAGWAIHLAGESGYALERAVGPSTAGALIYARSRPDQPIPDFYASDNSAMADLQKCATAQ